MIIKPSNPTLIRIDRNNPLTRGLMLAMPFNDGSGLLVRDYANSYHGEHETETVILGGWVQTPMGTGLTFNDASDANTQGVHVDSRFDVAGLPEITVEMWYLAGPFSGNEMLMEDGTSHTANSFYSNRETAGPFVSLNTSSTRLYTSSSSGGLVNGQIYQILWSFKSSSIGGDGRIRLYVNGNYIVSSLNTSGGTIAYGHNTDMFIGCRPQVPNRPSVESISGTIISVNAWSRQLDAIEVLQRSRSPWGIYDVGTKSLDTVILTSFNETGEVSIVADGGSEGGGSAELSSNGTMAVSGDGGSEGGGSAEVVAVLPKPVVTSVYNADASTWTGTGNPNTTLNQAIITSMVNQGVRNLTGEASNIAAWAALVPYTEGQTVAIKLNFNNTSAWTDDPYMNPHAEVVVAIIAGLNSIGVPSSDIWLCDPSRLIDDAFRGRVNNDDVNYYVAAFAVPGVRTNITTASFVAEDSEYATISQASVDDQVTIRPAQIFVDVDHIINVPQLKGHGGASITLGLKNHFGSMYINNATGSSPLHDYIYISGADYGGTGYNLTADINNNPVIRDKTRLIVGDGIMGHSTINYQNPHLFTSFGGLPPNTLFFGIDPIAVDSVMLDYLNRENTARSQTLRNDDIMVYAESIGLGVFEHWDADSTREYTDITYNETTYTVTYQLSGVTRDSSGNVLGSCQVSLFKHAGSGVYSYIGTITSNATTGAYSFTPDDNDGDYMVVAHKAGTSNIFDVSDNNLTPELVVE